MNEMRIAMTVTPVGPRGQAILDAKDKVWFAVQATAGFAVTGGNLEELWPWRFLRPDAGLVDMCAWRVSRIGSQPKVEKVNGLTVSPSNHDNVFAISLRDRIEEAYKDASNELDLKLHFPDELPEDEDELREFSRWNFPTRVSYLSSVPGELARQILATIFVQIDRDELFEQNASGVWQARADGLWVAPALVQRDQHHPLVGEPTPGTGDEPAWMQGYADQLTRAFGPGYQLSRYNEPRPTPLFDLSTHWLEVHPGDARFADLEGFLSGVVEPLADASSVEIADLRGELESPAGRPLAEDELLAWLDLCRIGELKRYLAWEPGGILQTTLRRLDSQLGGGRDSHALFDAVPESRRMAWPTLREAVSAIASELGIREAEFRPTIRRVAERSELDTVVAWIQDLVDGALANSASVKRLYQDKLDVIRKKWLFAETQSEGVRRERRAAIVQIAFREAIEEIYVRRRHLEPVLKEVKPTDNVMQEIRASVKSELADRWSERFGEQYANILHELYLEVVAENNLLPRTENLPKLLADSHLNAAWAESDIRPDGAGRPMQLVYGRMFENAAAHRVVHELNTNVTGSVSERDGGVFNEVTGQALLVRRHDERSKVEEQPWRLISGGVALIGRADGLFWADDEDLFWFREPLVIAEENVFHKGLLRDDGGYEGQLRHTQGPLEGVYANAGASADELPSDEYEESREVAYSYQGLGLYSGSNSSIQRAMQVIKAPPLRFGDYYQFAAAVIDAGGGLPAEISRTDEPWRLDIDRLEVATPPVAEPIPYRRRQAVGGINILPGAVQEVSGEQLSAWPEIPSGVALRVREWRNRVIHATESARDPREDIPAVLLIQGDEFLPEMLRPHYDFRIESPSVDEFTLRRWVTPRRDASANDKRAEREKLVNALTNMYVTRAKNAKSGQQSAGNRLQPDWDTQLLTVHDPAVRAFGVRVRVFDEYGLEAVNELILRELQYSEAAHRFQPIPVQFYIDVLANKDSIVEQLESESEDSVIRFGLPLGWFGSIEIWPLVKKHDFENRFDDAIYFEGLLERDQRDWEVKGYVAFQPNEVLFEVADKILPRSSDLHDLLQVQPDEGSVIVRCEASTDARFIRALQFVDRYEIHRDQWAWRNRPVLSDWAEDGNPAERQRLAASGLPKDAFAEPDVRDRSRDVAGWEQKAAFDRGFVDRSRVTDRWPRRTLNSTIDAGGVANGVVLHTDSRTGTQAGEYLRYGLTVSSRYAPLLKETFKIVQADGSGDYDQWRRIAMPCRIQKVQPPKVLAVIPLTRPLCEDPLGGTLVPFLVMVDETWFREFGIGERLEARLALETLDIRDSIEVRGELTDPKRPYRAGPLPDHFLGSPQLRGYYPVMNERNTEEDNAAPIMLDIMGPFGYTIDNSPDEARANASAFVLHTPPETGPHWHLAVQFRRVLDYPGESLVRSEPSDVYPLYTLPSESELAREDDGHEDPQVRLHALGERQYEIDPVGVQLSLDPLAGSNEAIPKVAESREKVRNSYLYFMLVSEQLQDANREIGIEAPKCLLRIRDKSAEPWIATPFKDDTPLEGDKKYRGRILEVLVNGKYTVQTSDGRVPSASSRLENEAAMTFRDFWDSVLTVASEDATDLQDAAGMIRRLSGAFDVVVDA